MYRRSVDAELRRRVGVALADAAPPDLARLWRAPEFDAAFAPDRALPALRATLHGLGIDLDAQPNVELDVEARPGKVPRAFCAPIRVPGRVLLVMLPQGGQDDYRALFHEAGHAEHFAHMPAELPAEDRVLGDNAVTEGFAFLFEHLLADPAWLRAHLGTEAPGYAAFAALYKLFLVRRYAAKLAYELELHAAGARLDALPARYAELLTDATGVAYPPTDYLDDVDDGFYCTSYLRAWAFEAKLVDHLRTRFGRGLVRGSPGRRAPARDVGPRPVAAGRGAAAAGRRDGSRLRRARGRGRGRARLDALTRRTARSPRARPRAGTGAPSGARRRRPDPS